jgi:hypothetical protein
LRFKTGFFGDAELCKIWPLWISQTILWIHEAIGSRFPPSGTRAGIQSIAGFPLVMIFGDFVD